MFFKLSAYLNAKLSYKYIYCAKCLKYKVKFEIGILDGNVQIFSAKEITKLQSLEIFFKYNFSHFIKKDQDTCFNY